tara:strand:+ start:482 stop:799 length:318 start_codon:yes stop_codon:yes gene_type:complete
MKKDSRANEYLGDTKETNISPVVKRPDGSYEINNYGNPDINSVNNSQRRVGDAEQVVRFPAGDRGDYMMYDHSQPQKDTSLESKPHLWNPDGGKYADLWKKVNGK